MARRIERLDDVLIDQIAAGEVVERPASVVKELLDNAIDAEATSVTIDLRDGGRELIRIADDGIGMSPADAELALERHATSKIRVFDDLLVVKTLGFRGEALPSIASVSRFALMTRPRDAVSGSRILVEGGVRREVTPVGISAGTIIEARDLFYNVPARRKFLKARQAEAKKVTEVCVQAALAHPALRLILRHDDRVLREFLPTLGLASRAAQVFKDERLRSYEGQRGELGVEAVFAPIEGAQVGAKRLFLLVNGRPVSDQKLARHVAFAFGDSLPRGRYPTGVVSLRLPPQAIDVNAHPQKTEVRFADEPAVLEGLTRLLAAKLETRAYGRVAEATGFWSERLARAPGRGQAVADAGPLFAGSAPPRPADPWGIGGALRGGPASAPVVEPRPPSRMLERPAPDIAPGPAAVVERLAPIVAPPPPSPAPARGFFATLRFVGVVRDELLAAEDAHTLYLVDARAAELERRVSTALAGLRVGGRVPSRRLLFPARAELHDNAMSALSSAHDALERLGFDVDALGPATLAIHRVPTGIDDGGAVEALAFARPLLSLAPEAPAFEAGLRRLFGAAARAADLPRDEASVRALFDALDAARGGATTPPDAPLIVRTVPLPAAAR